MPHPMASDNLTEEQASERADQIDEVTYQLDLELPGDPEAATFSSRSRIGFTSRQGGSTFVATSTSANRTAAHSRRRRFAVPPSPGRV